jgi:hypothetical protein
MKRLIPALLLAATLPVVALPAAANAPLPAPLVAENPSLNRLGEGRLRWLGLHVYDVALWVLGEAWSFERAFALDIRYAMGLKGRDIASRSVDEMRKIGIRDEDKLRRWGDTMARLFPDIKAGDRLVGVHLPGKEVRFYSNDRLLGAVPDPEFSRAFFSIWLDEKTSEPKLRAQMLRLGT